MRFRISLDTAMKATQIAVAPLACWPRERDASFITNLKHNLVWWIVMAHLVFTYYTFGAEILQYKHDFDHIIPIIANTACATSSVTKMIICRIQETNIQELVSDIRMFMKVADQGKLDVIQSYVDKCLYFHAAILLCCIIGPVLFILAPVVTEQNLILDCAYPFSTEPTWIWALTYCSQTVIVLQAGSMACVDFMFGIILWYGGARIQMLGEELEQASTVNDLKRWIRKHQELIEYMEKLKGPVRIVAMEVAVVAVFIVGIGGIVLMRFPPWIVAVKYMMFEMVAAMELFLYTWPADNIMEMSSQLSVMAYNCEWVGKSKEMMEDLAIIMHKSQTPIVIDLPGLFPVLTLEFYANVMKATFSYMTTIFAMLGD